MLRAGGDGTPARASAVPHARCLLVLATAVDTLRFATGTAEVGLLNLGPVWLFAQQLGFLWADGWFARRSRLLLAAVALAGYALLFR